MSFYSSNFDKHIKPEKSGWYIGFSTESGDTSFCNVDREPINKSDALKMLTRLNPEEFFIKQSINWKYIKQ